MTARDTSRPLRHLTSTAGRALLAGVLAAALLVVARGVAAAGDGVQGLVDEYGKKALVEVLMKARGGQITVRLPGGGLKESWGRPRLDLVDASTLARDADRAGMSLEALTQALSEHADRSARRERRLTPSTASPGGVLPLASIDPKHRIRPLGQRAWTVQQLMDDAQQENPLWPEELNRLRQQQAAIRNRKLEDILVRWTRRYGTMEEREIVRLIEQQYRDPMRECRRLRGKRATRKEYEIRGCDEIIKDGSANHRRELRRRLARPFEAFEAAMRPALRAHARDGTAGALY